MRALLRRTAERFGPQDVTLRSGIAQIAPEISWLQIIGAGCLAGIGFTMSIFIGSAAFQAEQMEAVRLAILSASVIAATLGMTLSRTQQAGKPADAEALATA